MYEKRTYTKGRMSMYLFDNRMKEKKHIYI
jgi:hypothetical protein